MTRFHIIIILVTMIVSIHLDVSAQQGPTPTPIPQLFSPDFSCPDPSRELDTDNIIKNPDFNMDQVGLVPSAWDSPSGNAFVRQEFFAGQFENRFVELLPGSSISTTPSLTQNVEFELTFCVRIEGGGFLDVFIGNNRLQSFPASGINNQSVLEDEYSARDIVISLSNSTQAQRNQLLIMFQSDNEESRAFIDNVQLVPDRNDGEEPTEVPTPTIAVTPTPSPTPEGGVPTETPVPELSPLEPTWTPTPALTGESLRLEANPPMIVVGPDDLIASGGSTKQVQISMEVLGTNNRPIDIAAIDHDATIQFIIQSRGDQTNVGTLLQKIDNNNTRQVQISERIPLRDLGEEPVVFVPSKVFDGTVRIAAQIEFDGLFEGTEQQQEIRGAVPIVIRSDPSASLTTTTGGFRPMQNLREGRQPGDRGFRPDLRTNLYFRERTQ